ncbi:unnamed protein product, partial [Rotaria sp. Silwood2]
MNNYEYSSYSSSTAPTTAAFDATKAIFNQVDLNQDGTIDRHEFQHWIGADVGADGQYSSGVSVGVGVGVGVGGAGANFESATYESSNISSLGGGGGSYSVEGGFGDSSFESSSLTSSTGIDAGGTLIGGPTFQSSSFKSPITNNGYDDTGINQADSYTDESNSTWSKYGAEVKGAGLYFDTNPQIIHRPAIGGVQTYTQNIKLRFLQPPPIPPPGPLIIKEVRPGQPPVPSPLRIKQQSPPLPQPPPLILRERPPQPPASQSAQTIIRNLPALPVPPRSVIIERIPSDPPRPRDIIIERWIPYGVDGKRKTIVQRAQSVKEYPKPRNIIIQYEPVQVRIVRQFQRLDVVQENPQVYVQRYGSQLLDGQSLIQQARAAGVVEDISPPAGTSAATISLSSFNQESSLGDNGFTGADLIGVSGGAFRETSSSFSPGSFQSSQIVGTGLINGAFESGLVEGAGAAGNVYGSSTYESSLYSLGRGGGGGGGGGRGGVDVGLSGGLTGGYTSSSSSLYESSGGTVGHVPFDVAAAAFNIIDKNKDGIVDPQEFKQFYEA